MKTNLMRVVDFFCGAGGFSEGFRQMGFDVVFGLDNWQPAVDTHELNHPHSKTVKMDILELKTPEDIDRVVPDVEVIIGSPPCVAFSGSNKAGKAEKGFGIRLIEAYLKVVAWKLNKPDSVLKYWILENVPNSSIYIKDSYSFEELGLPGGKKTALQIKERNILNAADFGVPQGRLRFFCGNYPKPEGKYDKESWVQTSKVLERLTDPLVENNMKKIEDPNYSFTIKKSELTDHFYDTTVEEWEWSRSKRLKEDHGYMGKMSFPEMLNRPSRTIMATQSSSTREAIIFGGKRGKKGETLTYRMPTIREIASIMSFPITYQFEAMNESSKYRLVGNAVCCLQAKAIADAILDKEGIQKPDVFIPINGNPRPTFDLTGRKRQRRQEGIKSPHAKYARHIPYLKIRGFRVEFDNRNSDFENERFEWVSVLHQGSGKKSLKCECKNKDFEHLLSDIVEFKAFKKDLKKSLDGRIPNAKRLQDIYRNIPLEKSEGLLGPDDLLCDVRGLIDRHFPEEQYYDVTIFNDLRSVRIPRSEIPLRILMGQYALNEYINKINSL